MATILPQNSQKHRPLLLGAPLLSPQRLIIFLRNRARLLPPGVTAATR